MKFLRGVNPITREAVVFAILAIFLLLGAVVVLILRTRSLPVCGNCGFSSVQRSQSQHPLDAIARVCFLYPHRCQKCLRRIYCFGLPQGNAQQPSSRAAAAGKR